MFCMGSSSISRMFCSFVTIINTITFHLFINKHIYKTSYVLSKKKKLQKHVYNALYCCMYFYDFFVLPKHSGIYPEFLSSICGDQETMPNVIDGSDTGTDLGWKAVKNTNFN